MDVSEDPDDFVYYGSSLDPLEEDVISSKKPIRIEDQVVTDENGRRRFHGAFTGGFSAGYYNTVDTKEGWRPAEFKSSRSDRKKHEQKPEDFMDQEDLGSFGFAPQVLRAKDEYGENQKSKRTTRKILATTGAIPGLPALHDLFQPVIETIGVKLLRSMGWKPHQGSGRRLTKKEKKERKKKQIHLKAYGCQLPPDVARRRRVSLSSDGEETEDEDSTQLFAPDDIPTFIVKPKTNTFGIGYSGLLDREDSSKTQRGFVLFEPTLSLTDKKKKLQIAGQAFGVGAFENEDEDIYARDDLSRYDFELGGAPKKKQSTQALLALPSSDLLEGFIRPTQSEDVPKVFPVPYLPRDFVPIHRSQKSRFDVKPRTETEKGRHDLNAYQRATILHEVLDMTGEPLDTHIERTEIKLEKKPTADEIVAQALAQIRKTQEEKASQLAADKLKVVDPSKNLNRDPDREAKITELKAFVERSLTVSSFQPFSRDADKQFRFDAFNILKKSGRIEEFQLLQPETMTEWERQRENEEFERSVILYQPLTSSMQNRFTSSGHVEENIKGGLVVEVSSLVPTQVKVEPVEKDPARRAALRKNFGALTRSYSQWKPDRLLCIRFNVPNPFADNPAAQTSSKLAFKNSGSKFSIFDVLSQGPSFVSAGSSAPAGPSTSAGPSASTEPESASTGAGSNIVSEVKELEWDKAARGELVEVQPDVTEEATEQVEVEEEVTVYQRPPMDLFKAIFDNDESEEEDEVKPVPEAKLDQKEESDPEIEEMDDGVYGPSLPAVVAVSSSVVDLNPQMADDDEWEERDQGVKRKKDKKKKDKKDKKKKEKKAKKSKKRRRSHSDSSDSSSTTEDMKILKKIVSLKKKHQL